MNTPNRIARSSRWSERARMGPQEEPPRDPHCDPSQEREADVPEVEVEAVHPECRLQSRILEA
jgi:hypothetical protein